MQRSAAPPHEDSHAVLAYAAEELDPLVSLALRPPRAAQSVAQVGGLLLLVRCLRRPADRSRHKGCRAVLHEGGVCGVRRAVKRRHDCALRPRSPIAAPDDRPDGVSARRACAAASAAGVIHSACR
eukprot:172556-Chlamydomonas_euryale.AAC.1